MAYSEYDRQMAIEIVRRNNGVIDAACLASIRDTLNNPDLPARTIRYWIQGKKEISTEKKEISSKEISIADYVSKALDEKLEDAAHKFVDHATKADTIEKMSGTAAMTSAAIAIEKMRLLRDLPTEIIGAIPVLTKLNELFKQLDTPLGDALEDYLQSLHTEMMNNRDDEK